MDKQTAKFIARIAENLPPNMSDDVMQGWIDNPRALQKALAGLCPPEKVESFLHRRADVVIAARTKPFDPAVLTTRKGLYVWDTFGRIRAAAKPVESTPAVTLASFDIVKNANDTEIRRELPEGHVFEDASAFCVMLDSMIEAQKGGKEGDLLTNGYANLFYVRGVQGEVFVVDADWDADGREWSVNANPLGGDRWIAGSRAFSASNC